MLKVSCGAAGRVRVVKKNSITGEVTHDSKFNNIFTDYGLNFYRATYNKSQRHPEYLHIGSGAHAAPHNSVTRLQNWVAGSKAGGLGGGSGKKVGNNWVMTTSTKSLTVGARGVEWVLSELGYSNTSDGSNLITYALVRDENNEVAPLTVSPIEILTVYYIGQFTFPLELDWQPVEVEGLPPTMAKFRLITSGNFWGNGSFDGESRARGDARRGLCTYTSASGSSAVLYTSTFTDGVRFSINATNRDIQFMGVREWCINHLWEFDPPITGKDNTKILDIVCVGEFSNVDPIEV